MLILYNMPVGLSTNFYLNTMGFGIIFILILPVYTRKVNEFDISLIVMGGSTLPKKTLKCKLYVRAMVEFFRDVNNLRYAQDWV